MDYSGYLVHFQIFAIFISFIYLIIRVIKAIRVRKINWFREITRLLFLVYILKLIDVTLFPVLVFFGSKPSIFPISYEKRFFPIYVNLNPFYYNFDHASAFTITKNIAGNMFMMLPYTILLPFNFRKMRKWYTAIATALLTSIGIELLQFIWQLTMLDTARCTDITDVLQNLVGAVVGFVLYQFVFSKAPIFKRFIINAENGQKQMSA
jgi:glycopeptide antibiotics resistance protein